MDQRKRSLEKLHEARQYVTQGQTERALTALSELEDLLEDAFTEAFMRGQQNMSETGY